MKASESHPLHIAAIRPKPNYGRVGLTLCPGKKDPHSPSGAAWDRDLDIDLDAVAEWGAALVLTLVEQHELEYLEVPDLGDRVLARAIDWLHLPIRDVTVPSSAFEDRWRTAGENIRGLPRTDLKFWFIAGVALVGLAPSRLVCL